MQTGVNTANLLNIQLNTNIRPAKLCLLNARSVCNKIDVLVDYVADHDLDILCITETWPSSEDTAAVSTVTPCGYLFEHVARSNLRDGGVGVLFKSSFTVDHSQLWPASSIECLDLQLRCHRVSSTIPLFVIYRPTRDLVERVGTKSGIIILGDFNVRYGDNSDAHARALHDILSDANMRQKVTNATHNRGNVLDLVITGFLLPVTDHFAVLCDLAMNQPRPPGKKITYHRFAAIDNSNFTKDLCECDCIIQPVCDVGCLYDQYYTELSCLVDRHAPLVQRNVTERPRTSDHLTHCIDRFVNVV